MRRKIANSSINSVIGLLGGGIIVAATSTLMAQGSGSGGGPGGGNPSCFENTNQSACDFYSDLTPDCADFIHGGGTCGVQGAAAGFSAIAPANAECIVSVYSKDLEGDCVLVGTQSTAVGCSVASGTTCP